MPKYTNILQSLDITEPEYTVEIEYDQDRHVLYVHVDGMTALRICRMKTHPILKLSNYRAVVFSKESLDA